MQINFNPHLPPGYLETHELDGMSWKSEKPVREALRESAVAWVVKKFERDSRQEMERQRQTNTCRTIRKNYTMRNVKLKIIRYPWERIPSVLINSEKEVR